MAITARMVKELRERTGAGMMDCKKALQETDGDPDAAVKVLRTQGLAEAAKRGHRTASEGLVNVTEQSGRTAMTELNCETDFVARNDQFRELSESLTAQAAADGVDGVESFLNRPYAGETSQTVEEAITQAVATIGENIVLSRLVVWEPAPDHRIASYLHMGGKIGVLVEGRSDLDESVLHDVAMHVAASAPQFLSREDVTDDVVQNEREIARKQALDQGKPENIVDKIVGGKVEKFLKQIVLLDQPFAKDTDVTVAKYLEQSGGDASSVRRFAYFRLGENTE